MNDKSQTRPWGNNKANPKRQIGIAEMSPVRWLSTWGFSPDEAKEISEVFDLSSHGSFDYVAEAFLERLHFAMEFYPFRGPYGWVGTWEKYGRKLQADLGINGEIIDYFLVVVKDPNMAMTGLRKVSDLMQQRSLTSDERENDCPASNGVIAKKIERDADGFAKIQAEPSGPDFSSSVNFGSIINSDHEASLDNFSELSPPEFNSEVAAEDYHRARQAEVSKGEFVKVSETRWNHEEVDWSIDDLDTGTPLATESYYDGQPAPTDHIDRAALATADASNASKNKKTRKSNTTFGEHIASIQLRNFKKFRSFRIDCGATNILTGRNNAGKSSILDALRVAHDVLRYTSRRKPEVSEFEGRSCASFTLPSSTLKIPIDNITWNYSDDPASVRISLKNGSQFVILLHPDQPIRAYLLCDGPVPRTTSTFSRQFPLSLVVVPTLGPVEENENYLTDKTISSSENTRTAHRHLRNILIRKTEEEFHEFSEEVSSAWPEISLERPRILSPSEPVEMMFFEERIPREVFWSGFGLQVWMQIVLQFMRGSDNSVLVLDEPDIYLHPELQVRMVELAARKFGQIFIATHSPTIIESANSEDILTISAKEASAIREA